MAGERCRVGEDNRTRKGGRKGYAMVFAKGTRSKGEQVQSFPNSNSNKTDDGPVEKKETGGERAGGDEASVVEDCRAYERKAQPLSKIGSTFEKAHRPDSPQQRRLANHFRFLTTPPSQLGLFLLG
ncbi:hypothetical protein CK203_028107 [Vitis vinifera]|uniref:Uncharacterized protein n=1 Tax=Vitis vinifera TaxID=29760 RepID=A0A438ILU1_VITVI|nr:hypothetical protein CK203_028107 [Vitis vinifera]